MRHKPLRRRALKKRGAGARARAPSRAHAWVRTRNGCRMRSGVFVARIVRARFGRRAVYRVKGPRFRAAGAARTIQKAKAVAAALIAQQHRELAVQVMKTVRRPRG